jgi:hypothetical protein
MGANAMFKTSIFVWLLVVATIILPSDAIARNVGHCPPGLAKKNTPCVPPGQAKKAYSVGDRFSDDYYLVREFSKYRLPELRRNESYYRIGDTFFRVNQSTREILQLFEAVGAVLN